MANAVPLLFRPFQKDVEKNLLSYINMKNFDYKKLGYALINGAIIIIIGVITLFILSKISIPDKKDNQANNAQIKAVVQQVVSQQTPQPSQYPDYDLLSSFKSINIAQNIKSYVIGNQIDGRVQKTLHTTGSIDRMYISIQALVDNGKPLSVYDDVYLTFNNVGGHVSPSDSLPTPPSTISDLLYSAQELPYGALNSTNKKDLDVLKMFNDDNKLGVDVFLSTARPGGLIKNFTIYYECTSNQSCNIQ